MSKTPKALQLAIDAMEPEFRKAFLAAVQDIRSNAQLAVVASAIAEGRINDALRALNVDPVFWAPLDDTIRTAYLLGGRDALAGLPVIPDPAGLGKWLSALRA